MGEPAGADGAAYDGSLSNEPDASASCAPAPSTVTAVGCPEQPPQPPPGSREMDTHSGVGSEAHDRTVRFNVEGRELRQRPITAERGAVNAAERGTQHDAECSGTARELRVKYPAPGESSSDDESEASTCDYETDSEVAGIDDKAKLPTFSMVRTLHESDDVVRAAAFPPPPVVERAEPTNVDWDSAMPPADAWPSSLQDLFEGNPAGARTWDEVTTALQKLVIYHAVSHCSPVVC